MDRTVISLCDGWRFHYGDIPQAWYKGYDDSSWQNVFLPHDWSVHMPFEKTNSSGTGYLSGGIGWYRLRFSLPEKYKGCSVRLVFDGIYRNSRIWCNSYHLGKRPYGYSEISYDITDFAQFGDVDNEVTVRVCRTELADSRWFTGTGITRKAYVVIEEKVHPVWHGIAFKTLKSDENEAELEITAELVNTSESASSGSLSMLLSEKPKGKKECIAEADYELAAGETKTLTMSASVAKPRLWSCEDPQLYTLTAVMKDENGERRSESLRVGIRSFYFDANKGFFLNDKSMKLKGVCVHHDGGALGAAMYKEVWLRRLLKLKAAGCNAIRTSHNPHMPELYDLCDELGFVMMDEAFDEWENPKNKWSTGHNVYPPKHDGYAEDFPEWHEKDLTDMIRRDRNHPSIIMWSIGNEIDYPNDPYCHPLFSSMTGNNDANKPASERQYDNNKPNAERLSVIARELVSIVKRTDTSIPVGLAAAFPELSSHIGFLDALDVVGYNYKEQFYEEDHKRFPDKPLLGSENGPEYKAWRAVTDNDYISGQFLWTGVDYLGEAHGWPIHGSSAGLLDLAGFEKPGYYRRKAFWSDKPSACLLTLPADSDPNVWRPYGSSWNFEKGSKAAVRCYTNQRSAELFLNGKLLGTRSELSEDGFLEWIVDYEPGTLSVKCGEPGKDVLAEASISTPVKAAMLQVTEWYPQDEIKKSGLTLSKSALDAAKALADSSISQLEITTVDENSAPSGEDVDVKVEVTGGVLLGLENGDLADLTPYFENHRRTFGGRLIAYIKKESDTMVKVTSAQLNDGTILRI